MVNTILIIEDEYNVSAFIKEGLTESGYETFVAYDGQTGLELIKQKPIDLIVLDVILPGMNGFEVAEKIKELGYTHVPIIFLSALGTTDNIIKGLELGADDYLTKPFKFKEFTIYHDQAAMKVGTDGVLLGAWASVTHQPTSVLDIGAGTGLIALMLAQRCDAEIIDAVEREASAFEQCVANCEAAPW